MSGKVIKPFVQQAFDVLEAMLANRPVLVWCLHFLEGAVLNALESGDLDGVIERAVLANKTDDPA